MFWTKPAHFHTLCMVSRSGGEFALPERREGDTSMAIVSDYSKFRQVEALVVNYINKGGHFMVISQDRLFVNMFRKTLTGQLELPAGCLTVVTNENRIMRSVKEMSVKKKALLVLMEAVLDHNRLDDIFRRLHRRIKNAKFVLLTTESELPRLALLREEDLADSWITKPIDINTLLLKVAFNIKPPGEVEKLVHNAEECLKNNAFRMALGICRRIFEIQPNSPAAYMIMGDAYRALDKVEDMVDAYEQANGLDEMYLSPLKKLERYFADKGNSKRRLEYMEQLDAVSPLNLDRKIEIGGIYIDQGEEEEAKDMFEEALQLASKEELADLGEVSTKIGDAYAARNREEAEEYYRRAMEMRGPNPEDMALYNSLGIALRKQGRWKDAVLEYKKAIKIVPRDEILYYNLALAYADGEQMQNAVKCVDYALKINPVFADEEPVVCCNLANIFKAAGKKAEALEFAQKALELNPDYKAARILVKSLDS